MDREQILFDQVKEVYKLWYRAMNGGEWKIYFKYFAFTVDEHEHGASRDLKPLINDEVDEEWIMPILEEIFKDDYNVLFMVKSRQQRATWLFSHVDVYEALANKNFLAMLQSTKKTNKAEELLRKHEVCYGKLPTWVVNNRVYDRDSKMKISNGSRLVVLSEEVDDAAGYTYNTFYFDEMSLHAKAKKVFGICLGGLGLGHKGAGRFRATSSPRQGSYMVELAMDEFIESTRKWILYRKWSNNGLSVGFNKRGHKVIYLHYSANRRKNASWRKIERKNYDSDVWEREFELNPDAVEGSKVYKNFNVRMVNEGMSLHHDLPLIRGWDFGKRSGVVWMQAEVFPEQSNDEVVWRLRKLYLYRELLQDYSDAEALAIEADEVTDELLSTCKGFNSYIIDYADPFSGSRQTFITGSSEIFAIEQKMMERCGKKMRAREARRVSIEQSIAITRSVISKGLEVDSKCYHLIKGFRGAYVMKPRKDEPVKDGLYEHIFDAFKYPLVTLFNLVPTKGLIYIPQMSRYLSYPNRTQETGPVIGVKINRMYSRQI